NKKNNNPYNLQPYSAPNLLQLQNQTRNYNSTPDLRQPIPIYNQDPHFTRFINGIFNLTPPILDKPMNQEFQGLVLKLLQNDYTTKYSIIKPKQEEKPKILEIDNKITTQ
ncbi:7864_t:CDS:2, partial [Ambispora leptoticha]